MAALKNEIVEEDKTITQTISMQGFERNLLVKNARQGQLSDPIYPCADFGTISYMAYTYNEETQRYTPVVVYQAGDYARENLSSQAKQLFDWLKNVNQDYSDPECTP